MLNKILINHIRIYLKVIDRVKNIVLTKEASIRQSALNEILISKLRALSVLNDVCLSQTENKNCFERLEFFTSNMELISEETDKMNEMLKSVKDGKYVKLVTNQMVIDFFNELDDNLKKQILLNDEINSITLSQTTYIDDAIKVFTTNMKKNYKYNN